MKKWTVLSIVGVLVSASPALALFNNGDFETGDFTGWSLDYGQFPGGGGRHHLGATESRFGRGD